jgi:hypothetical protein
MSSTFLTFIGHMPLGKAFSFGRSGILLGTERKPEVACDEAINEICGDDFSWSLRAVFIYVVL